MSERDAQPEESTKPRELRFIFVQMLFVLAVGEIARRTVMLLDGARLVHVLPGLAHLLLALIVVATSWVGWANSPVNKEWSVTRTFSLKFVVLLTDVVLVILYFLLISRVERPDDKGMVLASGTQETGAVLLIFGVYAIWDALTKARPGQLRKYLTRTWITWTCAIVVMWIWCVDSGSAQRLHVVLTDCLLILVVLTFRAFKDKAREEPASRLGFVLLCITSVGVITWTVFGR